MFFQDIIERLNSYWKKKGCLIAQGYDMEVGAGTFHPLTFFKSLGKESWKVGFVQPSRRPADGRYSDNPLRMQKYYQYQIILKPSPDDTQDLYIKSLEYLGIDFNAHDIRFVEDDWESPTLGASGLGWEVWLDSLEITQFTYFQQMGGYELNPVSCEITYGLERIAMFLQGKKDVFDLMWNGSTSYADMHRAGETDSCKYNFEVLDGRIAVNLFDIFENEAKKLLKLKLLLPAYENMLKTSHIFNLLDARGIISVTERASYIVRVRELAKECAKLYQERK